MSRTIRRRLLVVLVITAVIAGAGVMLAIRAAASSTRQVATETVTIDVPEGPGSAGQV
ncbi:MAG: hypothetical protein ACRDQH_07095 [Pseudonocardiaceae bacterium]